MKTSHKIGTIIVLCDDTYYLPWVVRSFQDIGPVTGVVSKYDWQGKEADYKSAVALLKSLGAGVVVGCYKNEREHRLAAIEEAKAQNLDRVIFVDADEIPSPELVRNLAALGESRVGDRVYASLETMWFSPEYRIYPPERLTPLVMLNPNAVQYSEVRNFSGGSEIFLGETLGVLYHLSYCELPGTKRVETKSIRSTHAPEFRPNWLQQCWLQWPEHRLTMRNFHPTHAGAFHSVQRRPVPEALAGVPLPKRDRVEPGPNWKKPSIVVPLYGQPQLVKRLVDSLWKCRDLIEEIVFVDDMSPDDAPDEVERQIAKWNAGKDSCPMRLIRKDENGGFADTCNVGIEATTGELIALVNSDIVVTRAGLIRCVESVLSSGTVGVAGALANNAGHHQQIDTTYLTLDNLELFAEDVALFGEEDRPVDMVAMFFVVLRRSALHETGLLDTRFKSGMFEDNDLCLRLRLANYTVVRSGKAFVHHDAHVSLNSRGEHPAILMDRNKQLYIEKHKEKLESGYISGLPGLTSEPIRIDATRKPEFILKEVKRLQPISKISLGIICRDEERVLPNLLSCITRGGFHEIIVVDTGSTDSSVDICRGSGVEPVFVPWEDDFAAARNETLRRATGDWFMFLDCDDTISLFSILLCLQAVINAPPHVYGFFIPVQFTKGGADGDTRVDHVKLFRNLPGLAFEGPIHEQIYGSISALGGIVAPLEGPVVYHSGYDYSPEGQAKKRARDWPLLWKALKEKPNDPYRLFNIGMTYARTGEAENAIPWLQKSIAASGDIVHGITRSAYSMLGVCLAAVGRSDEAIATFEQGLIHVGEDPEIRFECAKVLSHLGRHREAKEQYELIQAVPGLTCTSTDTGILGPKRLHNLALEHYVLGDYRNARDTFRRNIQEFGSGGSAEVLTRIALESGDLKTAREAHASLLQLVGPCHEWVDLGMQICNEREISHEEFLRSTLQKMPFAVPPLEAFANLLLSQGRLAEAHPVLIELDRLGSPQGTELLAILLARLCRYHEAMTKWQRVAERYPDHPSAAGEVEKLKAVIHSP